jgi:hypothetical protein
MRGFRRSLDAVLAASPAIVCAAAGLTAALVAGLVGATATATSALAQQGSGAGSKQGRERNTQQSHDRETAELHWGATVVWFRATDSGSVQVFASPGFRNPFAHPVTVSAEDMDRWAEFAQRLVVLSGAASAANPDSAPPAGDTAHMILGAGDVTLETASDQEGLALKMNIGANRQDGQTAMLFADGAPTAAAAMHDAARTARNLHIAAVAAAQAQAQAQAQAAAAAAASAASVHNASHATTRGMAPVVVSATATPVGKGGSDPTPAGVDDATVRNLVKQWQPELLYCYTEYGLRAHPDLSGTAVVRVALAQDGVVGYVGIVRHSWSGEGSDDVENCIRTKVATWRFPPAAAASAHEFPLSFSR